MRAALHAPRVLDATGRQRDGFVDGHGRHLRMASPSYDGGAGGRRVASLYAPNVGVNTALFSNLETMRARVRAALRSNPLMRKCARSLVANVIGTGIVPRFKLEDDRPEVREQLKRVWTRWVRKSDADGRTDFYGQTVMVARSWARTGEAIVRFRRRLPKDNLPVPFQLQLIPPDCLPIWKNNRLSNGNEIIAGKEFDAIGRCVAYWLHPRHPGEVNGQGIDNEPVRIKGDTVLHIFDPMEPGQVRGEPPAAAAILPAHILAGCTDNWLEAQRVSSLFALFFTSPDGDPGPFAGEEDNLPNDAGDLQVNYKSGSIGLVPPGFSVEGTKPPQLPNEYAAFMKVNARDVAGAWGVTYEQASGDYEGVTYSSVRSSLQEQHRECEQVQWTMFVPQFCQPVIEWFVTEAILADKIPAIDPVKFAADPEAYFGVRWIPQGWPWIDPESEANAAVKLKDNGLASRDGLIAAQGWDPEELDEEREEGMKREQRRGLPSTVGVVAAPTPDRTPAERQAQDANRNRGVKNA